MNADTSYPPPIQTPPILPGQLSRPPFQSKWPTVIGILAIIFGVLGILGYVGGVLVMVVARPFLLAMEEADGEEMPHLGPFSDEWIAMTIGQSIVGALLALVLLVGGIFLLKRRKLGIRILVGWSIAKLVFVLFEAIIQVWTTREQMASMSGQQGAPPMGPAFENMIVVMSVLATVGFGAALPVACLIVFNMKKPKAEIAKWPS